MRLPDPFTPNLKASSNTLVYMSFKALGVGVVWGGVCDHINHFWLPHQRICILKALGGEGAAMLKVPREIMY